MAEGGGSGSDLAQAEVLDGVDLVRLLVLLGLISEMFIDEWACELALHHVEVLVNGICIQS